MESALYGIYALVVFVTENSCVNTVRAHFPWSNLHLYTWKLNYSLTHLFGWFICFPNFSLNSFWLIPSRSFHSALHLILRLLNSGKMALKEPISQRHPLLRNLVSKVSLPPWEFGSCKRIHTLGHIRVSPTQWSVFWPNTSSIFPHQ